jgi:hypothetical protein
MGRCSQSIEIKRLQETIFPEAYPDSSVGSGSAKRTQIDSSRKPLILLSWLRLSISSLHTNLRLPAQAGSRKIKSKIRENDFNSLAVAVAILLENDRPRSCIAYNQTTSAWPSTFEPRPRSYKSLSSCSQVRTRRSLRPFAPSWCCCSRRFLVKNSKSVSFPVDHQVVQVQHQ